MRRCRRGVRLRGGGVILQARCSSDVPAATARCPNSRFEGEFTDACGLDGVSEETLEQVSHRTPGLHAWQDPHWLTHCNDAAAFIGEVGYTELRPTPRHSTSSDSTCA
ncbi:CbrC family protein [Streptomyces sp. NPDC001153]